MPTTQTATHTPGPWDIDARGQGRPIIMAHHSPHGPMAVCEMRYKPTLEEAEANARLIAAAPDLLAALRDAAQAFDEAAQHGYWDAAVERRVAAAARAALARVAP
jgi:hypothetical protein